MAAPATRVPRPGARRPEPARSGLIDALRGWAVLGVLVTHAAACIPSWDGLAPQVLAWGGFGVQLFFMISAFTLFQSLDARAGADHRPFAAFFARRVFRVLPLFWVAVGFYLCWYGTGPRFYAPQGIDPGTVVATLACAHGWRPEQFNAVVPGGWSIAVEMCFYLLVPVLYRIAGTLPRAFALFFVAVLFRLALDEAGLPAALFPEAPEGLLGEMRAFWLPNQLPVFLAGILIYRFARGDRPRPATGAGNVPTRLLNNGMLRLFGTLSFSMYITHFAVLDVVRFALGMHGERYLNPAPSVLLGFQSNPPFSIADWPPLGQFAALLGLTLLGTVLVSTVTYHLIERPGMRCGKWLIRRAGW